MGLCRSRAWSWVASCGTLWKGGLTSLYPLCGGEEDSTPSCSWQEKQVLDDVKYFFSNLYVLCKEITGMWLRKAQKFGGEMSQLWWWPVNKWNRKSEEKGDRWLCLVTCELGIQKGGQKHDIPQTKSLSISGEWPSHSPCASCLGLESKHREMCVYLVSLIIKLRCVYQAPPLCYLSESSPFP